MSILRQEQPQRDLLNRIPSLKKLAMVTVTALLAASMALPGSANAAERPGISITCYDRGYDTEKGRTTFVECQAFFRGFAPTDIITFTFGESLAHSLYGWDQLLTLTFPSGASNYVEASVTDDSGHNIASAGSWANRR